MQTYGGRFRLNVLAIVILTLADCNAPRAFNIWRAVSRPIPLVPPVIRAVFPFRRDMCPFLL